MREHNSMSINGKVVHTLKMQKQNCLRERRRVPLPLFTNVAPRRTTTTSVTEFAVKCNSFLILFVFLLTGKICYRVVKLFFVSFFVVILFFSFLLILFASSNSSGGDSDNNFSTDGNNIYSCSRQPLHSGTRLAIVCTEQWNLRKV